MARRGSSPLTRGKRKRPHRWQSDVRLIPAHAGKTLVPAGRMVIGGAHPRSRGENSTKRTDEETEDGSSPLTRGKRLEGCAQLPLQGLIPAHAGKTSSRERATASTWAHPRSRGENLKQVALDVNKAGSSPLTRGKRHRISPC